MSATAVEGKPDMMHATATEVLLAAARAHEAAGTLIFARRTDAREIERTVVQLNRAVEFLLKLVNSKEKQKEGA